MKCDGCNVQAEYGIKNGQEQSWLCEECLSEYILDIMKENDRVKLYQDDIDINGIKMSWTLG